jgi:uncharacterized protein YbcI
MTDSLDAAPVGAVQLRSPMLELANAVVRLYKELYGRGPTKARAAFAGPDTLVLVLEQSLTTAERNLVTLGELGALRETRARLQESIEAELRSVVEHFLGRRTLAYVSSVDPRHDVAVDVFTLLPE